MKNFDVLGINHVGLAPKDPIQAAFFFEKVLELKYEGKETVLEQRTTTEMFLAGRQTKSPPRLEILAPTDPTSTIAKFLEKKGSGIHHLALAVSNLEMALDHLRKNSIQLIDETPRNGVHNTKIAFVHPNSTGGLLIELVEDLPGH
jgi:methylmalonyl-CoA/ethylmalonyl-CoA epimerase